MTRLADDDDLDLETPEVPDPEIEPDDPAQLPEDEGDGGDTDGLG
jgi:hypothetical protein